MNTEKLIIFLAKSIQILFSDLLNHIDRYIRFDHTKKEVFIKG